MQRWFSGRILACHAGGPGSIPGRCTFDDNNNYNNVNNYLTSMTTFFFRHFSQWEIPTFVDPLNVFQPS